MSERNPEKQAEKRGGHQAGYEIPPMHERPGYRAAIRAAVEAGLLDEGAAEERLSGELHQRIQAEEAPARQPAFTQDEVATERNRAWREMLALEDEALEATTEGQQQLPFEE